MGALDALTILVEFARGLISSRHAAEQARIRRAVDEVTSTVERMITEYDTASLSQRQLWQAELRSMYERISILIPVPIHEANNQRADMLVNMIAAGRVYYWLRTFDGDHTLEGLTAEEVRREIARAGVTRSWSASALMVLEHTLQGVPVTDRAIRLAKERCIQMIGTAKVQLLAFS